MKKASSNAVIPYKDELPELIWKQTENVKFWSFTTGGPNGLFVKTRPNNVQMRKLKIHREYGI